MTGMRLVPVGHYLGAFPAAGGEWCHEVRRGPIVESLTEAEFGVWIAPADAEANTDVAGALATRGLIVAVQEGDGAEFARTHRLVPLLLGLGASTTDPYQYSVGIAGHEVMTLDRSMYELWSAAGAFATLWELCCAFATTRSAAGSPAAQTDPELVLASVLDAMGTLASGTPSCYDLVPPGLRLPAERSFPREDLRPSGLADRDGEAVR